MSLQESPYMIPHKYTKIGGFLHFSCSYEIKLRKIADAETRTKLLMGAYVQTIFLVCSKWRWSSRPLDSSSWDIRLKKK